MSLLYFAWVREAIGLDGETIEHPGPDASVADVVALLAARGGGYGQAFAEPERLRAALDQRFVRLSDPLGSGRELALFPPVTGG
nr:MoaD/ThiS family protein [Sphingobium subterraneum]